MVPMVTDGLFIRCFTCKMDASRVILGKSSNHVQPGGFLEQLYLLGVGPLRSRLRIGCTRHLLPCRYELIGLHFKILPL
jgi:hypothetical protein